MSCEESAKLGNVNRQGHAAGIYCEKNEVIDSGRKKGNLVSVLKVLCDLPQHRTQQVNV